MLKESLKSAIIGMLIGSFICLLAIATLGQSITITRTNIISNLIMSALIGLLSMIFDSDRLPFLPALAIHYLGVLLLVGGTAWLNGKWAVLSQHVGLFIGMVTLIYIFVWLGLQVMMVIDVRRINQGIRKRKH